VTYAALPVDWDKMSPAVSAEFYMDLVKTLAQAEARAEEAEKNARHWKTWGEQRGKVELEMSDIAEKATKALARCRGLLGETMVGLPCMCGDGREVCAKCRALAELEKAP